MKKRILIGTPLKGHPTKEYMLGLVAVMSASAAGQLPFVTILSICESTYVQSGRNELVGEARKHGCDEIVFWDSDIAATTDDLVRLMSHENVDIVGGLYSKRVPGNPKWTCHVGPEATLVRELLSCNDVPTGFLRIKMGVFARLDEVFEHRRYVHGPGDVRTEYFTVGLAVGDGCDTPAEIELKYGARPTQLPSVLGEDCMFCRMAVRAGFALWSDTKLQLRHVGEIGYPARQIEF